MSRRAARAALWTALLASAPSAAELPFELLIPPERLAPRTGRIESPPAPDAERSFGMGGCSLALLDGARDGATRLFEENAAAAVLNPEPRFVLRGNLSTHDSAGASRDRNGSYDVTGRTSGSRWLSQSRAGVMTLPLAPTYAYFRGTLRHGTTPGFGGQMWGEDPAATLTEMLDYAGPEPAIDWTGVRPSGVTRGFSAGRTQHSMDMAATDRAAIPARRSCVGILDGSTQSFGGFWGRRVASGRSAVAVQGSWTGEGLIYSENCTIPNTYVGAFYQDIRVGASAAWEAARERSRVRVGAAPHGALRLFEGGSSRSWSGGGVPVAADFTSGGLHGGLSIEPRMQGRSTADILWGVPAPFQGLRVRGALDVRDAPLAGPFFASAGIGGTRESYLPAGGLPIGAATRFRAGASAGVPERAQAAVEYDTIATDGFGVRTKRAALMAGAEVRILNRFWVRSGIERFEASADSAWGGTSFVRHRQRGTRVRAGIRVQLGSADVELGGGWCEQEDEAESGYGWKGAAVDGVDYAFAEGVEFRFAAVWRR